MGGGAQQQPQAGAGSSSSSSSAAAHNSIGLTSSTKFREYPFASVQGVTAMASLSATMSDAVREGTKERAPIDIICVIDKSGSMAGSKLDLVKQTMDFLFRQLRPVDRFALVSYDSSVTTDLVLTAMTPKGIDSANNAVRKLKAGSCTNLSGGLFEGLSLVDTRSSPAKVCSILLFTDGLANEGISDKKQLKDALAKRLERTTGASIYTFGFGSDLDAEMLRNIAEVAGGTYYFIEKVDGIPSAFGDCLGGLQSVVAQNIRLSVSAEAGVKITKVHNGKYALTGTVPAAAGEVVQLALGDMFDGENKDILVEVEIPALAEPKPDKHSIVKVDIKYFDVNEASDQYATVYVLIARPADVPDERPINELVEMQIGRIKAAEAIQQSRDLAEAGNYARAQAVLEETRQDMLHYSSASTPTVQGMVNELHSISHNVSSSDNYRRTGKSQVTSREMAYHQQRSNVTDDSEDIFETRTKKATKSAFAFLKKGGNN